MGKTELADASAYATDKAASAEVDIDAVKLGILETQQMTTKELELLRAQELHKKYGPTADYKPLHHSLHAATLVPFDNPTQSAESDPTYTELVKQHDEMVQDYNVRKGEKLTGEICEICQTPLYSDPGPQELGIYLHALAYADVEGQWKYTSPMPAWTAPPGSEQGSIVEPPVWDYEALGDEAKIDVDEERENAERRNRKAMRKNREMQG